MKNTVLIIAPEEDVHARAVQKRVETIFGARAIILDAADYPTRWQISFQADAGLTSQATVICPNGVEIQDKDLAGLWWRRLRRHRLPPEISDTRVRRFCFDEAESAFHAWAYCLGNRVINPLSAEQAADRKPLQLSHASLAGLSIPKTLVSNSPGHVRQFCAEQKGRVIFKVMTGTSWQFTETRVFLPEHMGLLKNLTYAPVIFQEEILATADIRVTIVDRSLFAISVHPQHPGAQLDWRLDMSAEIRPHQLPLKIQDSLLRLQSSLGLRFGAVDLRLTPEGEYVFLEVNPAGQWLFAEVHGDQPISRAMAAALLGRDD